MIFFSIFDCDLPKDIRTVFLDISEAFDKIWLPALIFKNKSFDILVDLLELIKNFLSNRFKRVVLNEQRYEWEKIYAGVPKRSILGPLFFLIYVNDLTDGTSSIVKYFADDTSLFSVIIGIIQHHILAMISIKLVIGPIHGKYLLARNPQNKHKK